MLLVYTHKISNRVRYTFRLILKELLGIDFKLTTDKTAFQIYTGPKISYSIHPIGDEPFFLSKQLLFESGIKDQNINVFEWNGIKCFFSTNRASALPFDPFAAAFYLTSRYEEYLPNIRDDHDRYDAHQSMAYQNGFLKQPVVNYWALQVKDILQTRFPDLTFEEKKYNFISTIDIDNAYAYKEKGFVRTLGAYLRSLFKLDFEEIVERTKVLLGLQRDPYDTYKYQDEIKKKYKLDTIYFFLLADYGVNDKNVPVQSRKFRSLIKSLADTSDVGIHPSYGSNDKPEKLEREIKRLSRIINREITKSRQHFLRLTLPDTYRQLIDLDITDDYTMGYANEIGFRAGICSPFYFYDIDLEIETKLKLHPFAVMEATLKYYLKLEPEQVVDLIRPLVEDVKKVNGTFITLWHNETMSDSKQWAGWKGIYEDVVKLAAE